MSFAVTHGTEPFQNDGLDFDGVPPERIDTHDPSVAADQVLSDIELRQAALDLRF